MNEKLKLPSKWVCPAALQDILKRNGRIVPKTTINTWIRRKQIPVLEIPVGEGRTWYLVDKTKVPEPRAAGRPFETGSK